MMTYTFYKYQGTGNDFIMIDDRKNEFPRDDHSLIQQFCDRKFGVGADGLILLQNDAEKDFKMVYFNADGYEGSMCGNGGRCAVAFAHRLNIIKENTCFVAVDGIHKANISNEIIELQMSDVKEIQAVGKDWVLDTGSPHYVRFINDINNFDVVNEGRKIRYSNDFKQNGINVNFIHYKNDVLYVATYERGVEDETLSCGTGITASALIYAHLHPNTNAVSVLSKGGKLEVRFQQDENRCFSNIWLCGAAQFVFQGVWGERS